MRNELSDIALWKNLKAGEQAAFETIYKREIQILINYGRKYSRDIELIEDCVHDLFVYIWNHRTTISDTDSIRKYLIISLRNRILNTLKKKSRVELKEPEDNLINKDETTEEKIINIGCWVK